MISYQDLDADITTILGSSYVNDAHNPAARIKYINFAIQKISESIFRNNFIFEYTVHATGDKTEYPLPTQHSTKQIFTRLFDPNLTEEEVIAIIEDDFLLL